jgi:hypothetical protein
MPHGVNQIKDHKVNLENNHRFVIRAIPRFLRYNI